MKAHISKDSLTAILLWVLFSAVILAAPLLGDDAQFLSNVYPGMAWGFLTVSFLILLYMLYVVAYAFCYKPAPALSNDRLPGCTVIVPAYNEGKHVAETLYSLLNSDYPMEKLEIIAINDGSQDDTGDWIRRAATDAAGKIIAVDLPRNQGKKHALYQGILMAKFDIVVTVDSDSIVNREGLRNIVSAFADQHVAGVAGNIRIKNLGDGFLPKMMDVGFMFGFEIIRSAQSVIGFVMCTPGALSAYRKSAVMPFLTEWLNQTFMGTPAKIGEDRAIATMILQHGYKVVFQSNAIAWTCIPYTYGKFCRMLIRWTRSDIRENWIMLKHVILHRMAPVDQERIGLQIHLAIQIMNTVLPALCLPLFVLLLLLGAEGMFLSFCFGIVYGLVGAMIPALIYARRVSFLQSVWALAFSVYAVFALSWLYLYSFLTVRNSQWLTRDLPQRRHTRAVQPAVAGGPATAGAAGKYPKSRRQKGIYAVGQR